MNKKFYTLIIGLFFFVGNFSAQIVINDASLTGGNTYNWTADNVYMIDGYVYLEAGGVLNIEPGTTIIGKEDPTSDDNTSVLIITKGAQINAIGTATDPIIFTAESVWDGSTIADQTVNGLWGGVILLGNGTVARPGGMDFIEGIPDEPRTEYGGGDTPNDTESSGTLRYISIRHAGGDLDGGGNDLNGLTLGGVGSGTSIDYVEIYANFDDGIEWFGGTVDVKHLIVAFAGDDGTDYDFGWRGKGQYWFVIQQTDDGGNAGEHDGAKPDGQAPFSKPTIYNATYIGSGATSGSAENEFALLFRDNAAGTYANSIFTDFANEAISVEDLAPGEGDSHANLLAGDLVIKNNLWFGFGSGSDLPSIVDTYSNGDDPDASDVIDHLTNNANALADPMLAGIDREAGSGMLDPRLNAGSPGLTAGATPSDSFFDTNDFHGAFNNTTNWALGWTALDEYGHFGNLVEVQGNQIICIQDQDIQGGQTYNWTKDNTYCIDGYVYLEEGGVLNIEAGTTIYGMEEPSDDNDNTSALIITRGAQINAIGTATEPIIFTAESVFDGSTAPDQTVNGLWGGLIILGNGTVARPGGVDFIEGIPDEPRTEFGGGDTPNDTESSGTLNYISIRHAGGDLDGGGNDLNGLTLGGVGSGTEIDYVEIYANFDDGIEWFGGTVDVKHLIVAFAGDDGTDYDFGWRGKGQYWFVIQQSDDGGNAGEHDGAKPDGQAPFSKPTIYNATYIGSGATSGSAENEFALLFRDNAAGTYANSIFTDFANEAISVEDLAPGEGDSHANLLAGDLVIKNNLWFGFGSGSDLPSIVDTYSNGDDPDASDVIDHLTNNANALADPMLAGIDRVAGSGLLDPRPDEGSPALTSGATPSDDFFDNTDFHGAFSNANNWALGWTALDEYGHFGDLVDIVPGQVICVQDQDLQGGQTYNWTKDNVYCIDGYVYLEAGGVLNIEEGTTIYGMEDPTSDDNTSALIITKGAQIFADGSVTRPIVFTAESVFDGSTVPDQTVNGLWGGLIILGNATVARPGGLDFIEGIPDEPRTEFGGGDTPNDTESSGRLTYISIRHAGGDLDGGGNDLNGLTLGGVGSGTEIDYVEIYANFDDGIEWFGGTVDVKHLVVAFAGDDGTDYDFGWRGRGQHWFVIQQSDDGGNAGEHDGAKPDGQAPFSKPTIYNATYIGSGATSGSAENEFALLFRDNAGGTYANSIFTDFANEALSIEDLAPGEVDAHANLLAGDLVIKNNLWFGFGSGSDLPSIVDTYANGDDPDASDVIDHLTNNSNALSDPLIAGIDRVAGTMLLDPRLDAGSPGLTPGDMPTDNFFDPTFHHGAFNNTNNWALGWTALDEYGHFGNLVDVAEGQIICIQDQDLQGGQTYNWSKENTYCIDGYVYLEEGGVLNIEAGTTIYGLEEPTDDNDNTSALIITRGAQINAVGTADAPIIFTAESVFDGSTVADETVNGLWGGLIVLGNGTVARPGGVDFIEGIPDEPRTEFGGGDTPNDTESSGTLKYISIRHAGGDLDGGGNDLNGLTLGGVGSGTEIDYVEIFANFDDGIEWFGGTVNVKHLAVAFAGDDGTDYDFGWRGKGQYWFVVQQSDDGGNAGEHDGAKPDGQAPFSKPTIYNATYIGSGADSGSAENEFALLFRDNAGGTYANSIFTDFANEALSVEDLAPGEVDAHQNLLNGDLVISNNYWWSFGSGSDLASIVDTYANGDDPDASDVIDHLTTNNNQLADPVLCGIGRTANNTLNPTLAATSPALQGAIAPSDPFFDVVSFHGAFDDANNATSWLTGWTALDQYGFLTDACLSVNTNDPFVEDNGYILNQNTPNPASSITTFEYKIPSRSTVTINVYDLNGRLVSNLVNAELLEGTYKAELDVNTLSNGTYFVTMQSETVVLTRKMTVIK